VFRGISDEKRRENHEQMVVISEKKVDAPNEGGRKNGGRTRGGRKEGGGGREGEKKRTKEAFALIVSRKTSVTTEPDARFWGGKKTLFSEVPSGGAHIGREKKKKKAPTLKKKRHLLSERGPYHGDKKKKTSRNFLKMKKKGGGPLGLRRHRRKRGKGGKGKRRDAPSLSQIKGSHPPLKVIAGKISPDPNPRRPLYQSGKKGKKPAYL